MYFKTSYRTVIRIIISFKKGSLMFVVVGVSIFFFSTIRLSPCGGGDDSRQHRLILPVLSYSVYRGNKEKKYAFFLLPAFAKTIGWVPFLGERLSTSLVTGEMFVYLKKKRILSMPNSFLVRASIR